MDLFGFDALVVSPGVPLNTHPIAAKVRAAGVPIIGDIELFAQARAELPPHKVVGITGTNGKSTTTALIHHILDTAGVPSLMGGNIGLPILAQEPLPEGGVYVLELSSYQIDLTQRLDPDVAILLNITPDHLDRYADFQAYADSKARLFAMQSASHTAIIGIGDAPSAAIARSLSARGERLTKIAPGVCMDQSRWPSLQGPHNAQNALAAIAAAQALGVPEAAIDRGLATFAGLPHRMQRVAERNGVAYVDDSKATNPESVAPALAAFDRIHWILGGQAKSDDLDACRPHFGHVTRAYTIGEAGPRFAAILRDEMAVEESGTLDVAVKAAARSAVAGDTVLLSPACASFDQFRDYEARGDAFRAAVEALA
ncbi:UDP-N-acetylmuramoyl-L-alanine--D-glutamate ligase [Sphingomonas koreensis]|nr:UDP-N-acetylmuramoyl-L-alanine--D-glutamate ligase [Sphingomonas koreensis]